VTPKQQRILEIETAKMRYAWAKAEVQRGTATPALTKYLEESLEELRALRTAKVKKTAAKR
jgi:hypothetical protein